MVLMNHTMSESRIHFKWENVNRFTAVCILLFILIMAGGGAQVVAEKSLQDTFLFLTFYSPDQVASKYIRFPKEERPKDHQLLILDLKPILYILGLASGEQDLVVELHYINRPPDWPPTNYWPL